MGLADDEPGGTWAVTAGGASHRAPDGGWKPVDEATAQPFRGMRLRSVQGDARGDVWFGTDSGLYRIHEGAWSFYGQSSPRVHSS